MTLQHPDETAAAEAAYDAAVAEAEANEPANRAPAPPPQPTYALYPVEWRGERQEVADEPTAEVEPLSVRDVWKVVNLLARMGRAAAPDKEAYDRRVQLNSDLLLYGSCYVDAETGERVDPRDVFIRRNPDGGPGSAYTGNRDVLDASMVAGAGTYANAKDDLDAQWEHVKRTRLEPALAEITADLRAEGVLTAGESLTV